MFDVMFLGLCNYEGSTKSQKGEGSSTGKCIDEAEGMDVDQSNLDTVSLECCGKSESDKISCHESPKGLSKIFWVFLSVC